MWVEDKIIIARNSAVAGLAKWLKLFGFVSLATVLLLANERFVCPLCLLIRAIRREKPHLAARFSKFCSECRAAPRHLRKFILNCIFCFFRIENRLLSDICLFNREVCLPLKVPIFIENMVWRI